METKCIYFASDFHLGVAIDDGNHHREMKIVRWLDSISDSASEIYLLGDLFDFWFEYKYVVPKGFIRILGKLAELSDKGIKLHIFTGNHDVWMFDYFPKEIAAIIYRVPITLEINGIRLLIGHGDALGPGDYGYKFIKKVFSNKMAQRLFAMLHPYLGVKIARFFSRKSRESTVEKDSIYLGDEKEFLVRYCNEVLEKEHYDYFIFGHRHLVMDMELKNGSRYINLGEWFTSCSFAKIEGTKVTLERFEG